MAIPIGTLDVARVLPVTMDQTKRNPPIIWAREGLLKLHVAFNDDEQGTMAQENSTRIVLGYIARSLCESDPSFYGDLWEGDLDWIVPSSHTVEKPENRYPVADVWEFELRSERLEVEKRSGRPIPTGSLSDGLTLDPRVVGMTEGLWRALGRLCRLMDVRQVLEKMDAKEEGYQCWSKMQRLAICSDHPFGLSVEAEFEKLSAFYGRFQTITDLSPANRTRTTGGQTNLGDDLPNIIITPPTSTRTNIPLEIPELLEKIHAFIPLRALRHSVIYVCRQWFLINRQYITPRELVWEYHYQNECMDKAVPILAYVGKIKLHFRSVNQEQCQVESRQWKVFFQALKETHTQRLQYLQQQWNQEQDQDAEVFGQNLLYEPTPILDFSLSGTYPSTRVYELIPYLSHVTRLRIDQSSDHHVYPCKIFQGCPHLQHLYVGSRTCVEMFGDWLPSAPEEQQPFTLRELILHNAYLKQDKLEEFLGFTPHLMDLHLYKLSIKGMSVIDPDQRYDCRALIAVIKSLSLPLKTFHFSVYERYRATWDVLVDEDMFKSICQDSREWTFATGDLTPQLFQNIQHLPNTLTTLNMVNRDTVLYTPDSKLHLFLCTSPQLLHLRIPGTTYHMSYLDLYHRIPSVGVGDRSTTARAAEAARYPDPGVWACRGLRTLHIAFETPGGRRVKIRLEHSRVVFGYIAKVCPALIELEIHVQTYWERFAFQRYELAGGFCLLAGLRDLERLRITAGLQKDVDKLHDMDWIISPRNLSSSTGLQNREERRKIVSQWRGLLLADANKDSKRLKKLDGEFPRHEGNTLGWEYCDNRLREALGRVGLLLDVKMMIERIDGSVTEAQTETEIETGADQKGGGRGGRRGRESFECWPHLRRINIGSYSPFGLQSADQELQRLFPVQ